MRAWERAKTRWNLRGGLSPHFSLWKLWLGWERIHKARVQAVCGAVGMEPGNLTFGYVVPVKLSITGLQSQYPEKVPGTQVSQTGWTLEDTRGLEASRKDGRNWRNHLLFLHQQTPSSTVPHISIRVGGLGCKCPLALGP